MSDRASDIPVRVEVNDDDKSAVILIPWERLGRVKADVCAAWEGMGGEGVSVQLAIAVAARAWGGGSPQAELARAGLASLARSGSGADR
jgi:hypothetical protein